MNLPKIIKDIKTLRVQGATAVAEAVILGLRDFSKTLKAKNTKQFFKELEKTANALAYARPTEPLAQNLVKIITAKLQRVVKQGADIKQAQEILDYLVDHELRELAEDEKQLVIEGEKIIETGDRVLTYCHSSTVEKIFIAAKKSGKKFKVFAPETRPLFQGRITAKNLSHAKVDVTMIVDSRTDDLIHQGKITKILIGADAILKDNSIINKVGSFGICEDASQKKIPVYAAAISLKKVHGNLKIPLENRSPFELWKKPPKNLTIENPAFDKVPAKFITGIITEKGIL